MCDIVAPLGDPHQRARIDGVVVRRANDSRDQLVIG